MKFRKLNENEIEVRVGNVSKNSYTLLLYKNARADMNILDECVGAENWQRDHKEIKGNLYCGVGINCAFNEFEDVLDYNGNVMGKKTIKTIDRWIWKWDCGTESNTEKEKGEASDSFKRACVNWGIGRELYTSPVIKVASTNIEKDGRYFLPELEKFRKFVVQKITYQDDEIDTITIVDTAGVVVYTNELMGGSYVFKSGKHAGKTIAEVDDGYLDWIMGNPTISENIKANIRKFRGID